MSIPRGAAVYRQEDLPVGKHWVILTFEDIYIPGDERSKTNPGHGYGPSTVTNTIVRTFANESDWKLKIQSLENPVFGSKIPYVPLIVERPVVSTRVEVAVKVGGQ